MNTQTHVLMGIFGFGGRNRATVWSALAGGLLPDLPMIAVVVTELALGKSGRYVFEDLYFKPWFQYLNGMGHSFFLWGLCLVVAMLAPRGMRLLNSHGVCVTTAPGWPSLGLAFAAAGLLHCGVDFLCHGADAHMQLLPFSDWRFNSPVSYYDPRHFGRIVGLLESVMGGAMAIVLMRRTSKMWHRAVLGLMLLPYVLGAILLLLPFPFHQR